MSSTIRDEMVQVRFKVKVLVGDLEDELLRSLRRQGPLYQTNSGKNVFMLKSNPELSHTAFPQSWRLSTKNSNFPYEPDFSNGNVYLLHHFPKELEGVDYQLAIEAYEVDVRGSYCQVTTNFRGEKLRPYRYQNSPNGSVHRSVAVFSQPRLSLLRLESSSTFEQDALFIRRANVHFAEGFAVVTMEQVFHFADPSLETTAFDELPSKLAAWRPALQALYERQWCTAQACKGHYHLD